MNRAVVRAPRMRSQRIPFACVLCLSWLLIGGGSGTAIAATAAAAATDAQVFAGDALPAPVGTARDDEFGVGSHQPALERRVWMWQWQATPSGVQGAWSDHLLPAPDAAHRNPLRWPLPAEEWRVAQVLLDGRPLEDSAVRALGAWQGFRPSFDALPPNLAASFQPEGDGLGTADDPQHPAIGDLHVAWREWRLLPLSGRVQLDGNVWRLRPAASAAPTVVAAAAADTPPSRHLAWLLAAGVAVLALVLLLLRRRTRPQRR